uniref:Uncharacterized protein n=1 Tax=Amphimedon queenslandica TaxID=400682 RepID=A0A1X7SFN0_AMPQE
SQKKLEKIVNIRNNNPNAPPSYRQNKLINKKIKIKK